MSEISLKSITGITSITTPTGVDNQLTVHNNNTTEAVKFDNAGNVHINNQLEVAGVSTFSGGIGSTITIAAGVGSTAITLDNSHKITFGSAHELEMFHDGSTSYIKQRGIAYPSRLKIISENSGIDIMSGNGGGNNHGAYENAISCDNNGKVKIYHAGVGPALETNGDGVTVPASIWLGAYLKHQGDLDTRIGFPAGDTITAETAGSERLRIFADGSITQNYGNPNASAVFRISKSGSGAAELRFDTATANTANLYLGDDEQLRIRYGSTEHTRFASDGTLLVAHTTTRNNFNSAASTEHAPIIQLEGTNQRRAISVTSTNNNDGGILMLARQNGNPGTNTVVSSGDQIGRVDFQASGGTNMELAAQITAEVDGTPGDNDMPGRLLFKTTADGANNPTERLRISSLGNIKQNLTSPSGTSPFQNTHWYDREGGHYTLTATDNNYLSATKTDSNNGYNDIVYKRVRMSKNCDIEFELSGSSPAGIYRHVGFVINGDGTGTHANWDRLVFRSRPANTANNQIRIDKGGGGYGFNVESSSIPTFFDGNE